MAARANKRTLEGYASATSVDRTDTFIDLHLSAPADNTSVKVQVFRMGWYSGSGARLVYTVQSFTVQHEDDCPQDSSTGRVECTWGKSTLPLPVGMFTTPWPDGKPVSGYYLVRLTTPTQGTPTLQNYILFVVRDDARAATFLMNNAVTTYQAYNTWGTNSLYNKFPDGGFHSQVSFDRPMYYGQGVGDFMDVFLEQYLDPNNPYGFRWPGGFEYPMVRFLEREGYDVKYATDIDLHAKPHLLDNVNAFLSVGHDEYWSKDMHDNLEAARNRSSALNPTNIAFFSGNSVYWITNILPNTAQTAQNRIIETHKNPSGLQWLWQNCTQVEIGNPIPAPVCSLDESSEQKLVGSITTDGAIDRGDIVFGAPNTLSPDAGWIVQDTGLTATSRLAGMIGYESQTIKADKFPVPLGQTVFAQSTFKARPAGLNPERLEADMSLYQQPANGALVVSLGSPDWNLGLDIYTDSTGNFPSSVYRRDHPAIPQITRNILEGVGRLPHVTPQPPIGPGYTVSLFPAVTCFTPDNQGQVSFTVNFTNPAGREAQRCTDFPWCDAISVYNVTQNDDDPPASKTFIPLGLTSISVRAPLSAGTYTADYVTVDRVWPTDYGDNLRTIWRAAKSPAFSVPCP